MVLNPYVSTYEAVKLLRCASRKSLDRFDYNGLKVSSNVTLKLAKRDALSCIVRTYENNHIGGI